MTGWRSGGRTAVKWILFAVITLGWLVGCRHDTPPASLAENIASDRVKLEVTESGLYRVSLVELQAAGLAVSALDVAQLHLSQAGTAVPYHLTDEALIFYGQESTSRYTAVRPYVLEVGRAGVLMAETAVTAAASPILSAVPQSLRLEENHLYLAQTRQDESSDVWFWQTLGQESKIDLTFDLAAVSDESAVLRLHLWGTTTNLEVEPDHDFDVILNGQTLATVRWDGQAAYTSETPVPAGLLRIGPNELTLDNEAAGASFLDIMELDRVELDYMAPTTAVNDRLRLAEVDGGLALTGFSAPPLLFDLHDEAAPRLLTGWEADGDAVRLTTRPAMHVAAIGPRGYLSPTRIAPLRQGDWRSGDNQADLIILTTDELAPALADLVEARRAEGLSVALVPVAEVYDEFGFGQASPESIQAFVAYASANWQAPPPRYLFLVGDATTDYHNYQGSAPHNHIPSLLVPVVFSGETVSDSRLVDVDGDMKPDMAVGRWPVDTAAEVADLVARTLAYEAGTAINRALFAADGAEAQFATIADALQSESGITDESAVLLAGAQADEVAAAWNEGAWLTTYIGHGSVERWGKEDIFYPEAVSDLAASTPPIVLQLTCLTGLFAHPELTSLSETMLRHEKGPVLIVAATSLTLSAHQEPFALGLLQQLQSTDNSRIGDAFQAAKRALAIENNNGLREINDTFVLLGDPSARIIRPNLERE